MSNMTAASTPASANKSDLLLHVPFLAHLGVEVESMEPGHALLSLEPRPEHYNSWGSVHGGVLMTLLDVCMAISGRAYDPANLTGVTVDMSTSFISPGKGKQMARGRVVARSSTLWRCEGEIRSAETDELVARAIGTFKFRNLASKSKAPDDA
jgi:uncharacterized protein (TIGR00369 family)